MNISLGRGLLILLSSRLQTIPHGWVPLVILIVGVTAILTACTPLQTSEWKATGCGLVTWGGQPTGPEELRLVQLNKDIGEREKAADRAFFEALLADDFVFRRANGDIVHKAEYLKSLETVAENPYERLDTCVREGTVDKDSAVVTALVTAKRKSMQRVGSFTNVRMFKRENDEWKLVAWINTKQG